MNFLLFFCLTPAIASQWSVSADAGVRHEPGVETRLLFTTLALYQALRQLAFTGQVAVAGIDNPGLAGYGLGLVLQPLLRLPVRVVLGANHQQWRDWQTGENRASGLLTAEPRPGLWLGAGAAWRVPVTDRDRWSSPLAWRSEMPEWNLAYLVHWRFLATADWHLAAFLSNLDRYGMHAPQQFPFGLEAVRLVRSRLLVHARLATSIKGLSGLLLSLGDVSLRAGVSSGF